MIVRRLAAAAVAASAVTAAAVSVQHVAPAYAQEVAPAPAPHPSPTPTAATVASAPVDVAAIAGDASALVTWTATNSGTIGPTSGFEFAIYLGGTLQGTSREHYNTSDISDGAFVLRGLTNGASYTFTVRHVHYVLSGGGEALGEESGLSAPVIPAAGLVLPDDYKSTVVEADSTASLETSASVSESDPVATAVYVPAGTDGGELSITESSDTTTSEPTGYSFFGQQVEIVAPTATVEDPLVLGFQIDASLIPPGTSLEDITLFRTEGTEQIALLTCTGSGAGFDVFNSPADPPPACVHRIALADGDVVLYALTDHASSWNTAVVKTRRTPVAAGCTKRSLDNYGCDVATKR